MILGRYTYRLPTLKKITRRACLKQIAWGTAAALPAFLWAGQVPARDFALQPTPTAGQNASMAGIARRFMDRYAVPGLSVAIARHGQFVYAEGFGFADRTAGERVTPSHLFRIASVAKSITSAAVYSLVEQGQIGLDDPVFGSKGLLGFDYGKTYSPFVQEVTVRHLLTHTSGGWEKGKDDPMFFNPAMGHRELIAWTLSYQPLSDRPGTRYSYSNFGYCILGRVLEKVTGKPYPEFVQRNILARCGIENMRLSGNTLPERAPGEAVYYGQNGENPYGMNVRRMDAHGGWLATPSDLVRFATHVDGFDTTPNILGKDTIRAMATASAANLGYASGWSVNAARNWWHAGSLPGTAALLVRTASGLCWAALANTRTDGIDLALDETMWDMVRAVPAWRA
jgi:CubicO group peptidase (beta-lactamase class C family)